MEPLQERAIEYLRRQFPGCQIGTSKATLTNDQGGDEIVVYPINVVDNQNGVKYKCLVVPNLGVKGEVALLAAKHEEIFEQTSFDAFTFNFKLYHGICNRKYA